MSNNILFLESNILKTCTNTSAPKTNLEILLKLKEKRSITSVPEKKCFLSGTEVFKHFS